VSSAPLSARTLRAGAAAPATAAAGDVQPGAYAGIVTRGIAFAVDAAIVVLVALVVAAAVVLVISVLPGAQKVHVLELAFGGLAFLIWWLAYWSTFWTTTGQTPGARVMRIQVTRLDGTRLRAAGALLRAIAMVLAAIPLFAGYLPILVNEQRRGLPDFVAGTVVTHVIADDANDVVRADGRLPPRRER
jgi:uncharacterized RDD family membrane protein YckC